MLLVHVLVYFLSFISSFLCHGLAAACDCGTPLTLHLTLCFLAFILSRACSQFLATHSVNYKSKFA